MGVPSSSGGTVRTRRLLQLSKTDELKRRKSAPARTRKLEELEQKYDAQFRGVFDAIRELMEPTEVPETRRIGFQPGDD